MGNIYVDKLEVLTDVMSTEIAKANDCTTKMDLMAKELYSYSEIISSFFVGKKESIQNIYEIIKSNSHPYNKVFVKDINVARYNYSEYFEGLTHFANMVCGLNDNDNQDTESINSKIEAVKERDREFVDSLFENGESGTIDSAMKEVEVLINIYDDIDKFVNSVRSICTNITSVNCEKYNSCILNAFELVLNSIRNYNVNAIKTILLTYSFIEESVKVRESVKGSPVVPKYQIF